MVGDYVQLKGKVTGVQEQKVILEGTSGKVTGIRKVVLTSSATCNVRLQDTADSPKSLTAIHELVAGVPLELKWTGVSAPKTNAGKGITLTNSAGNVAFDIEYWLEP